MSGEEIMIEMTDFLNEGGGSYREFMMWVEARGFERDEMNSDIEEIMEENGR